MIKYKKLSVISHSMEKDMYYHYFTSIPCEIAVGDVFEYNGKLYKVDAIPCIKGFDSEYIQIVGIAV